MAVVRPAIYVASLADYNNGVLHGAWIDATLPPAAIERLIEELLRASPTTRRSGEPAEEWAIHDSEGFGSVAIDPHESLEDLEQLVNALARPPLTTANGCCRLST